MGSRKEQSENRRRQLLEVGLSQFIEYGFYGTSTRKIAEIAGVSSALMFHYFPSKEALYLELIRIGCTLLNHTYEDTPEPFEYFRREAERFYSVLETGSFSAKMFVFMDMAQFSAAYVSKEASDLIKENKLIQRAAEYIQKGQEQGTIRPGNPLALSIAFYGALQSVAEWKAGEPEYPVPEKEWLLDIIRSKKP